MSATSEALTTAKVVRDFTFITPQRRRLTEYEALTVHQQPDALVFDRPHGNLDVTEWYLLRADGSPLWKPDSTRLRHANWFAYRDPAQQWQRTYVRHQEQQETSIARVTEDAGLDGSLAGLDPTWVTRILCGHYRAWSFFEYAIFRALAAAQREALADTLGNVLCFQSFDHLRHAQDVVIYLVELETYNTSVTDDSGKDTWLNSPAYQPARTLAEQIMATSDWGELMVGLNLVVGPLLQQIAVSELVRRNGLSNHDAVAPSIVMTAERDRRRNLAATQAFVNMVLDPKCADASHNRTVIQQWLDEWTVRAEAAAAALAPVFEIPTVKAVEFAEVHAAARSSTARIIRELTLQTTLGDGR
jgi:Methane/Phenol/Toluene Hydroxylase